MPLPLLVLLLNQLKKFSTAKFLTFFCWVAAPASFSCLFLGGVGAGTYIALFSAVPWPFILFSQNQKGNIDASLLCLVFAFMLLFVLNIVRPIPFNAALDVNTVWLSMAALTVLMLLLTAWPFQSSYIAAEIRLMETNADLQNALEEISTLWGVLPICSVYEKIRDNEGTWNPLESCICEHTDAEFTHGYCPDCLKTFYADAGIDTPAPRKA